MGHYPPSILLYFNRGATNSMINWTTIRMFIVFLRRKSLILFSEWRRFPYDRGIVLGSLKKNTQVQTIFSKP